MTWVIGGSTIFGYGILISDIQVSWKSGITRDCLQKIYPVGNHIFAGFSGSVKIGFRLLQDLKDFLLIPEQESQRYAWHPDWVAENWYERAKAIFEGEPAIEKDNGASIILVGTSPDEDIGIPGMPFIYNCIFRWPNFKPEIHKGGINFVSIGSGSGVELYRKKLEEMAGSFEPLQMEVGMHGGYSIVVMATIWDVIRNNPQPGISEHLHVALIERGKYAFRNNDTTITYGDGSKKEIRMPQVATSYSEFLKICNSAALQPEAASC